MASKKTAATAPSLLILAPLRLFYKTSISPEQNIAEYKAVSIQQQHQDIQENILQPAVAHLQ